MAAKKKDGPSVMEIVVPRTGGIDLCILGTSPFIFNAMSEKAKHDLLLPSKKTKADKEQNLKHQPLVEYRGSVYAYYMEDTQPTRLYFPAGGFKKGMMGAALDQPGATKAGIGRLVWVVGDKIPFYGVPQIFCAITRSADIGRTPDVRTRAIVPKWACKVSIRFASPVLGTQQIANLVGSAGIFMGVGDWRQEKGSGSYGQYEIVSEDDKEFQTIVKSGGRQAQDKALATPTYYDRETEELLTWYDSEILKMGERAVTMAAKANRKSGAA